MHRPAPSHGIGVSIFGAVALLASASVRAQQTIHVPADQPSIQAAINSANPGDTVLVAPGTYLENVNFSGKAISVVSSDGPQVTTIDGGANGSVITFSSSETTSSVLSGFTIRNGFQNGGFGGGIYISGASPTISGNVITANHAAGGSGIYITRGSPIIQSNTISGNDQTGAGSSGDGGGGILITSDSSVSATPQIIGNTIANNSVANGGNGGGISVQFFSTPRIQNNFISGNTAYNFGGGVALQSDKSPVLVQNLIVGNFSMEGGSGAGVYVFLSSSALQTSLTNNTIAANSAADNTSGIFVGGFGQNVNITNNIVAAIPGQVALTCSSLYSSASPSLAFNDFFTSSGNSVAGICDTSSSPGNFSADPLFMSAVNSDFHLHGNSPAVEAGTNAASNLPNTDFDGNPRVAGIIDLGAYELVTTSGAGISPGALTFAAQVIGSTGPAQTSVLSSTGSTGFQISSVQPSGDFIFTTTCPALGQPGGFAGVSGGNSCTFDVSFSPSTNSMTPGTRTGNLTVNGTNGESLVVALSGTALSANATASLSTSSLSFSSQVIGTTSASQPITLTNLGGANLTITSIAAGQQFSEADNCPASLAGDSSCTINVSFTPSATGSVSGSLVIADNSSDSPQTVTLTGTGITPAAVSFSPASLAFGAQVIGTTSAPQSVTLTNTGAANLNISSFQASLPFAQTNNCPAALAGGASCTIQVTFTPQTAGHANGGVTVFDNAAGSPHTVTLSGTGLAPAAVSISPSALTFGSQQVGTTSPTQTVTLTNTGDVALNISSISANGAFTQTNSCPAALAGHAGCAISIAFAPLSSGQSSGTLSISDSAASSPQSVSLSGTGIDFSISASPSSVTVSAGSSASVAVSVSALGGAFNQTVALSCSGMPAASTCSISPSSVTPGSGTAKATMQIQTTRHGNTRTPAGTFVVTISGASGNQVRSTTISLTVH